MKNDMKNGDFEQKTPLLSIMDKNLSVIPGLSPGFPHFYPLLSPGSPTPLPGFHTSPGESWPTPGESWENPWRPPGRILGDPRGNRFRESGFPGDTVGEDREEPGVPGEPENKNKKSPGEKPGEV